MDYKSFFRESLFTRRVSTGYRYQIMQKKDKQQLFDAVGMVGSIGLNMVATVAIGLLVGRYADNYLGSHPWGTVFGIIFGMLAGLWATYKKVIGK